MLTTAPRGTKDIMPADVKAWRYLEETMRKICAQYGYKEIRTPVFEHTELFLRGIGETTDVVEKEKAKAEELSGKMEAVKERLTYLATLK